MSELLTEVPVSEIIEDRVAELERVLTPLVSANANVIVKCPWLGNSEVTLSEAMIAYPKPMIEEDPYVLVGIVMELLANRVTENEEDETSEAEEDVKSEEVPSEENATVEPREKTPAKTNEVEQNQNAETKTQNSSSTVEESGKDARPVNRGTLQTDQAKPSSNPSENSAQTTSPKSAGGSEPAATTRSASENSTQKPHIGAKSAQDNLETVTEHEEPANNSPGEAETTAGTTELSFSNIESETIADYVTGLTNEKSAGAEAEPTLAALDYQISTDGIINFAGDEILPDDPLEDGLDPDEQYSDIAHLVFIEGELVAGEEAILIPKTKDILVEPEQTETYKAGQPERIDFNFEEAEDILAVLTERIESSEPESAKTANELLDKIAEVSAKLEFDDGENIVNETEIQEELEELFTKLFDNLGSGYTPGLIKSLAFQAVKLHLADKAAKLKDEETDKAPQDNGTHEIIKKLLLGSDTIRKVMSQACAIGKSALHLYSNRILVEEYLTR